ncbi:hypothetical protein [Spongiactinospora sp. TRM90649]|uniref:hypothetical protein n=1 Tax=Spongiactinospora sp. TRM90649 TaxID=3031114 RepID=UPI0023F66BAC|nr:hypothetical protein [Spongiactinospora sp. TRM90649]MDF5755500.1 hypothetical protein [Spongiactinospora sp. TRM90649]
MIHAEVRDGTLVVSHEPWTRLFVRRSRTVVPLAAIREVRPERAPLGVARGPRSGLVVSGFLKVGFWAGLDGVRRLVAADRTPGLRIVLSHRIDGVDELVLSLDEADRLQTRLPGAASGATSRSPGA